MDMGEGMVVGMAEDPIGVPLPDIAPRGGLQEEGVVGPQVEEGGAPVQGVLVPQAALGQLQVQ